MKEPQKIKLTDAPQTKKVNLTRLLPIELITEDIDPKSRPNTLETIDNEDNKQNNS